MGKKLTIEYIREEFTKKDYTLLSTNYKDNKDKLLFICSKGHNHSICWNNFQQGYECTYCKNHASPTIEYIRQEFAKKDYKLLSTEYKNSQTKLDFVCDRGHIHSIRWGNFKQGQECAYCKNHVKLTLEFVKQEFIKKDFELLSTEYINSSTKLVYRCKKCNTVSRRSWSCFTNHKKCPTCHKNSLIGSTNPNFKGGVNELNLPLYKTYNYQLEKYEQTHLIQQNGLDLLGVNCLYCNKIFVPSLIAVYVRMAGIKTINNGEGRFYCSDGCKEACPTYHKSTYPKGYAPATSREMQPQFRKMVLERDNWTCQKCGANKESSIEIELHAHHIDPVANNPIESCDVDNGITLCRECHIEVHKKDGCKLNELRCSN